MIFRAQLAVFFQGGYISLEASLKKTDWTWHTERRKTRAHLVDSSELNCSYCMSVGTPYFTSLQLPSPPQPFFPSTQSTQIEANILQILTLSVVFSIKNGTNKKKRGGNPQTSRWRIPWKNWTKIDLPADGVFFGWSWGILGNFARIHPAVKKTAR